MGCTAGGVSLCASFCVSSLTPAAKGSHRGSHHLVRIHSKETSYQVLLLLHVLVLVLVLVLLLLVGLR
jgi:hypothetical protein